MDTIHCYVCDGELMDFRGKRMCSRCMTINETCCDGGQCHPEHENTNERNDERI